MVIAAAGVAAAATIGGSVISSNASNSAARRQGRAADAGLAEQQRQFDAIQELLRPYQQAGVGALGQQQTLLGLNGNQQQQQAINALQSSPYFQSQLQRGENSILQNASATGGLRGGNTQAALAQFSPQLLAQTIQQQFQNLGGIANSGLNAAGAQGQLGQQFANNQTNILQQRGAIQAGNALAQGQALNNGLNGIAGAIGYGFGNGSFGGFGGGTSSGFGGGGGNSQFLNGGGLGASGIGGSVFLPSRP